MSPSGAVRQRLLILALQPLRLALELLHTGLGRRQVLRHGAADVLDGLADAAANVLVGLVGRLLALDLVAAQLLLGLRRAEEVGCELCAAHMVEDLLALLETLTLVDVPRTEAAIQAAIAMVLEDGEVVVRPCDGVAHGSISFMILAILPRTSASSASSFSISACTATMSMGSGSSNVST